MIAMPLWNSVVSVRVVIASTVTTSLSAARGCAHRVDSPAPTLAAAAAAATAVPRSSVPVVKLFIVIATPKRPAVKRCVGGKSDV